MRSVVELLSEPFLLPSLQMSNAYPGPQPKGKKETRPFVAFEIHSENLSGLNSDASSPQIHGPGERGLLVSKALLQLVMTNFQFLFCCEHFEQA